MGSVIDIGARRRRRPPQRVQPSPRVNLVTCSHCGESHPIVRLRGGEQRCVTAFFDDAFVSGDTASPSPIRPSIGSPPPGSESSPRPA